MKYLGIDYGTKRIGLAQSDESGTVAFPLVTIDTGPQALSEVATFAKENRIEKIVIGESKNFRNEPNLVMENIEQFKKDLAELTELPVEYEPEFMTSAQAAREGESKDIDASAAALILQAFLDKMKSHGGN